MKTMQINYMKGLWINQRRRSFLMRFTGFRFDRCRCHLLLSKDENALSKDKNIENTKYRDIKECLIISDSSILLESY